MQTRRGRAAWNDHLAMLLAPAHRAVVRRWPIQPRQPEQALLHAHGLAQREVEQAFDRQAELDGRIAEGRSTPALADRSAVPAHVAVQPDHQRATRFERCVVGLPVSGLVLWRVGLAHAVILSRLLGR